MEKTPRIYLDGKRLAVRPQCVDCGVVSEKSPPSKDWDYYESGISEDDGWRCPDCRYK